jgi:hypothetical protein
MMGREMLAAQEDQQDLPWSTSGRPSTTSGRRGPLYPEEPHLIRREEAGPETSQARHADSPSAPATSESASVRTVPNRVRTLAEQVKDATLPSRSSSDARVRPDVQEGTVETRTLTNRLVVPDASLVEPEVAPSQLGADLAQAPQDIRVSAPEYRAATVKVNIGRIEVRAITPHPPPAQRSEQSSKPARPGPALSLDAYLTRRNQGQR